MATRNFSSLLHFATFCGQLAAQRAEHKHVLEEACEHLEKRSKQVIGTYDLKWTPLAESTQRERVRLGYPADEPLLRTGQIRESIEHNVEGNTGRVGTNYDIAVYQELGTSRAPPRSFLRLAAVEQESAIVEILKKGLINSVISTNSVVAKAESAAAKSATGIKVKSAGSRAMEQHRANKYFSKILAEPKLGHDKNDPSKTFQGWMYDSSGKK